VFEVVRLVCSAAPVYVAAVSSAAAPVSAHVRQSTWVWELREALYGTKLEAVACEEHAWLRSEPAL